MRSSFPFHHFIRYCPKTGTMTHSDNCTPKLRRIIKFLVRKDSRSESYTDYHAVRLSSKSYDGQYHEVLAHRLAWKIHYGSWPDGFVDHIDGNGLNNAIDNLRVVSQKENMRNKRIYRTNKSGVPGVIFENDRSTWRVSLGAKKIGRFSNKFDACCARFSALLKEEGYTDRHIRPSSMNN